MAQTVRGRVKAGKSAAGTDGGRRILEDAVKRRAVLGLNGFGLSSISIICRPTNVPISLVLNLSEGFD